MTLEINLKKMNQSDAEKVSGFLKNQYKMGIKAWTKQKTYSFNDTTEFKFKNDLYVRTRKKLHKGLRYEAISNKDPIGQGSFGVVKRIKGTLAISKSRFNFKKTHKNGRKRVVKIQRHEISASPALHEYKLSKRAKHLAIKKPNVVKNANSVYQSCTTMDELPGKPLFDILKDDRNKTRILTTAERIQLTKELLHILKEQVTEQGIVHRDIKLDNILVDLSSPLVVNIIDYGLGMLIDQPDNKAKGSAWFVAPEVVLDSASTSAKSDVFSMARVIALFWNVSFKTYRNSVMDIINFSPLERIEDIFKDINDLTPEDRDIIKNTLLAMLANNPTERISLDEAIDRFASLGQNKPTQASSLKKSVEALSQMSIFRRDLKNDADSKNALLTSVSSSLKNCPIETICKTLVIGC
jgi:serine/threonine protein kinase